MHRYKRPVATLLFTVLFLSLPFGCNNPDTVGVSTEQSRWIDVYYASNDLTGSGPVIEAESRERSPLELCRKPSGLTLTSPRKTRCAQACAQPCPRVQR